MKTELQSFYSLVRKMQVAMLVTRQRDGHLVSRPMANQRAATGADLWFVTSAGSAKLAEIGFDPHVNVTYYRNKSREWVSVSGHATASTDRLTIHKVFRSAWKVWFPPGEDPRYGTADDPRIVLIGIDIHSASFMTIDKPQPVVLFELAKSLITGAPLTVGTLHELEPSDT